MQKKIVPFIIAIIFVVITLNGCIEENTSPINQVVIEGNGSYSSIQEAIDAASDGDTIYVYEGIFHESLIINKSISLIGEGEGKTIIEYIPIIVERNESIDIKTEINVIDINVDNCSISGFKIIGNNASNNLVGIKISSMENAISDNIILNFSDGIHLGKKSKGNTIYNNVLSNNQNGIYFYYATINYIFSNNISSNSDYGIFLQSISDSNMISKNIFYNNTIGIRVKGSKYNEIFQNKFIDNNDKGIYICCGAKDNYLYNNSLINNTLQAIDPYNNNWDKDGFGNYWDDYEEKFGPNAKDDDNDGIWDKPYTIQQKGQDNFPLVEPVDI